MPKLNDLEARILAKLQERISDTTITTKGGIHYRLAIRDVERIVRREFQKMREARKL